MADGRKAPRVTLGILATVLAMVATALAVGLVADSASAKPDLETVKKRVERLDRQAEEASERYNDAKVKLGKARTRLAALNADLGRQREVVDSMRHQVAAMVVEEYQGDTLSMTSQVILSEDPDAFLDNLNAVTAYNDQRGQVMAGYGTELDRLTLRKKAVREEARKLRALKKSMAEEKAEIDEKAADAQALLEKLEEEAYRALLLGDYSGAIPDLPASGRARAAVKYAMAQVGKRYAYGGAGPSAYDCSGLTMRAWGSAGVGLPHSSRAQRGSGRFVPESQLRPGDLVFYYSPISHVGMYIGNGMIVNALNPRSGVRVSPLHSMPYSGAVRPG